jgi:hypothetical protein
MTDEQESLPQVAHRWLGIVGLFIAPTTLISGLCYFFGAVYTSQRLQYFAVDSQSLAFTTADYVTANVKVFFFAVVRVLFVCAVLAWVAVAVHRLAESGRCTRALRIAGWVAIAIALGGLGVAISWLLFEYPRLDKPVLITALIGAGTGLLVAGYWILVITRSGEQGERARPFATAERISLGIAAAIMVAALFWLTDIYAAGFGERDGRDTADGLWAKDIGVVLDTKEPLEIPSDLSGLMKVTKLQPDGPGAGVTYRYECLRKLEVRNNRWVLVPAKWTRDKGFAVTVTPDSSNRILTRRVDAQATGKNPNVFPYWQCPEAVRTFDDSDLQRMLVDPDEARKHLGVEKLVGLAVPAAEPDDTVPQPSENCVQAADPNPAAAFRDSGFVAGSGRKLTDGGTPLRLSVDESVVTFANPAKAADFIIKTENAWLQCRNAVVNIRNGNVVEQRTLGGVGEGDGIVVLDSATPGDRGMRCSHAIAAKSNVVVDVHVCGSDTPAAARPLASAIRDGIPN